MWTVNRYAYFFRPLAEMRSGATGVFGIFPITNEFFQDLRRTKQEKYLPKYSAWIAVFSINDATKYAEERDIGLNNYYTPPGKIPTYSCHDVSVTNVLQTSTVQYHFYLRVSLAGRTKYISVKWFVKEIHILIQIQRTYFWCRKKRQTNWQCIVRTKKWTIIKHGVQFIDRA